MTTTTLTDIFKRKLAERGIYGIGIADLIVRVKEIKVPEFPDSESPVVTLSVEVVDAEDQTLIWVHDVTLSAQETFTIMNVENLLQVNLA